MSNKQIGDYQILQVLTSDGWGARFRVEHVETETGERGLLRVFNARILRNPSRMAAIHHAPEFTENFHHSYAACREGWRKSSVVFALSRRMFLIDH